MEVRHKVPHPPGASLIEKLSAVNLNDQLAAPVLEI